MYHTAAFSRVVHAQKSRNALMEAGGVLKSFVQLFFPETCAGCRERLREDELYICGECHNSLTILTPGERLAEYNGRYKSEKLIDEIYPLLGMTRDSIEIEIIHRVKYRNKQKLAHWLGQLHAKMITDYCDYDFVSPVPLHKLKLLERGYNQSELIARGISAESNIPFKNCLKKTVYTETQTHKSAFERRKNIRNTFEPVQGADITGKWVLLADDVLTTGATVSECAKVLKENGAAKVAVATIALTI